MWEWARHARKMGPRALLAGAARRDNRSMARVGVRDQRGQTAAEYLGVWVLITLTVGALMAMNPGVGQVIGDGLRAIVCRIAGGDCGGPEVDSANPFLPTEPCTRTRSSNKVGVDVTAFSIKAGGTLEVRRELRSDGTVAVTIQGSGEVGAELGVGAEGKANLGERLFGEGGEASASLTGELTGARTWIFPDAAAADQFISDVSHWAMQNATATGVRVAGGPVGGWFAEQFYRNVIADKDDYQFPGAEETYFKGGINLEGNAGVTNLSAYAGVEGALRGALGGKYNHRTGDMTLFYEVKVEAEGSAGLNVLAGGGAGGEGTALVELTLDRNGNPKSMTLTGTGKGSLEFENVGHWRSIEDITDGLKGATIEAGVEDTNTWEFRGQLNLDDPEARAAALNWLASTTSPANPNALPASLELARQLDEKGILTINEYDGTDLNFGGNLKAAAGIKFGIGGGYEETESQLVNARYREPGTGFVDIPGCL